MSDSLRARLARGVYDGVTKGSGLAFRLNTELGQMAHDRHLHVFYSVARPSAETGAAAAPSPEDSAQERHAVDENNCGFRKVEQLEGNIGYLRFDSFEEPALCEATVAAAMTFIAGTGGLIIDLRENGGGKADMVALVVPPHFVPGSSEVSSPSKSTS
jgi:hypothetical protein